LADFFSSISPNPVLVPRALFLRTSIRRERHRQSFAQMRRRRRRRGRRKRRREGLRGDDAAGRDLIVIEKLRRWRQEIERAGELRSKWENPSRRACAPQGNAGGGGSGT
jgi:hypothetical protein